jgi:hypothetical protein
MIAVTGELFALIELKSSNHSRLRIFPYFNDPEAIAYFYQRAH